jgi:D-alanyl-D-alanine carboxypeptidase
MNNFNNNFNNNDILDSLRITKSQLRIFLCTFLAMFIMMCLQYLGVRGLGNPIKLIMPIPQNAPVEESDALKTVRPMLEAKPNTFQLKNPTSQGVAQVHASSVMDSAAGYAVVDLDTGEVIAAKVGSTPLPIASITKVMTAVVALDLAASNEMFTVSEHAASIEPTKIGVIPGQKMTLDELLNGLMLVSGNDTAEVIREGIDTKYGEAIFIDAMNAKAKFLGLKNSSFANPQGFDDPKNYSSVEDLAVLTHYALTNYPELAAIARRDYHYVHADNNHKQFDMYNWNGLLGVYPEAHGLKIGNTGDAGKTTIVTAKRGGKTLAAIVLGAPRIIERDLWAAQLLDLGYERTLGLPPVKVTEEQLRAKYQTWKYWN